MQSAKSCRRPSPWGIAVFALRLAVAPMAFFLLLDNGWALATLTSVTYLIYTLLLLAPAFMPSDASRESWVRWCLWTQYARAAVLVIAAAGFWVMGFRFTASLLAALAMLTAGFAMLTSRLSQP